MWGSEAEWQFYALQYLEVPPTYKTDTKGKATGL